MSARGRGRARGRARPAATQDTPPRQPGTRDPVIPPTGPTPGASSAAQGVWGEVGQRHRPEQPGKARPGPTRPPGLTPDVQVAPQGAWGRAAQRHRPEQPGIGEPRPGATRPPPGLTPGATSAQQGPSGQQNRSANQDALTRRMDRMSVEEKGSGDRTEGSGPPPRGSDKSEGAGPGGKLEKYSAVNFKTHEETIQLSKTFNGLQGMKLRLVANYIPLVAAQNWIMYQYTCYFAPELERADWRRQVLQPHMAKIGQEYRYVFDKMALYLMKDLGPEVEWTSAHPNTNFTDAPPVTIKLTRASTNSECHPNSPVGQHVTNVLFKKALRMMNLTPVGRCYYDMERSCTVPEYHMEVYPGFHTAIAPFGEGQVMLQLDVKHRILRRDTAYDIMYEKYNSSRSDQEYKDKSMKALLGVTVMTKYNQKTYRINDINFEAKVTDTFQGRDGEMTFIQYYKQAYNIDIDDHKQPMLVSKPKEKDRRGGRTQLLYLIPELCYMTGLSDELANDFKVKQALQKVTRMDAGARVRRYCEFATKLASNKESQKNFEEWNLHFSKTPVEIDGRRLPRTELYVADKTVLDFDPNRVDWGREMNDKKLIMALDLTDWVIIHTQRDAGAVENFLMELVHVSRALGFRFQGNPYKVPLRDNRDNTYKAALAQNITSQTQLIMAVISGSKSQYDVIKKYCCRETPVVTQCIRGGTLMKKGLRSIATKVILQMQCKLGAELWAANPPGIDDMRRPFMVVGVDVYHDSERKGQSVVGVVSSLNKNMTRYYSQVSYQTATQEIGTSFKTVIFGSIKKFGEKNGGRIPETVIVYRDGVGDGQLLTVLQQEIAQFKDAFRQAGNPDIKLLYIVVQKRINTRMFTKRNHAYDNPPPGTVVDTTITRPEWYDFFLVSQSVRQGTVSPTHYNILYDSVGWTPDQVQKLTYLLTHLYYNWQGTIRVPAPCQYAHKLAYVVGTSIHDNFDPQLADKLWFL